MSPQDKPNLASNYNPEWVAGYFDEFGVGEWERLVKTPADEVSFYT